MKPYLIAIFFIAWSILFLLTLIIKSRLFLMLLPVITIIFGIPLLWNTISELRKKK